MFVHSLNVIYLVNLASSAHLHKMSCSIAQAVFTNFSIISCLHLPTHCPTQGIHQVEFCSRGITTVYRESIAARMRSVLCFALINKPNKRLKPNLIQICALHAHRGLHMCVFNHRQNNYLKSCIYVYIRICAYSVAGRQS